MTIDRAAGEIRLGERTLDLEATPHALLTCLADRHGALVATRELREAVWPDTHVGDGAVRKQIHAVRKALSEAGGSPGLLSTLRARGYRYEGPVAVVPESDRRTRGRMLAGRDAERAELLQALEGAEAGRRQLVLVSGEPGIGKSALLDTFIADIAGRDRIWVCRGDCRPHFGAAEAYMPIFEALFSKSSGLAAEGRLSEADLAGRLRRSSPSWLANLPFLTDPEVAATPSDLANATPARMMREVASLLDDLTRDLTIALVIEDLQWSDPATLKLLAHLAWSREPARLLVVGSHRSHGRPSAAALLDELRRDASTRPSGASVTLGPLPLEATQDILRLQRPPEPGSAERLPTLAARLAERSGGNPLFLENLTRGLERDGTLTRGERGWHYPEDARSAARGVPDELAGSIAAQFEGLSRSDREILEAAAIAGTEPASVVVAAGCRCDAEEVELSLARMAREGHFLEDLGEVRWPDGTRCAGFRFVHALYREVLEAGVVGLRRRGLHRRVGECLEGLLGAAPTDRATELALHFEAAEEPERAIRYMLLAGERAIHRAAHREAVPLLERGLALTPQLGNEAQRNLTELMLHLGLGSAQQAAHGFSAPGVKTSFRRATQLAATLGDSPLAFNIHWGLSAYEIVRGEFSEAAKSFERLGRMGGGADDEVLELMANYHPATVALFEGRIETAAGHMDLIEAAYREDQHPAIVSICGFDASVANLSFLASARARQGFLDTARALVDRGAARARRLGHEYTLAAGLAFGSEVFRARGEIGELATTGRTLIALGRDGGYRLHTAIGYMLEGYAIATTGSDGSGLQKLEHGLQLFVETGARVCSPQIHNLFAEACLAVGETARGLEHVEQGLAASASIGECWFDADLHLLDGRLRLAGSAEASSEAEARFRRSIQAARAVGALTPELAARTALGRLLAGAGEVERAREQLVDCACRFTEGAGTPLRTEAARLLGTWR